MSKSDRNRRYREKASLKRGSAGLRPRVQWRTALRWVNSPVGIPPLRYNTLSPEHIEAITTCRESVPLAKRGEWLKAAFDEIRRARNYKPSGSPAPPVDARILHDAKEIADKLQAKKLIDN